MALFTARGSGTFPGSILIVALDGWVNAGQAGTTAAEVMASGGEVIAEFDPDLLFDFRQNRPVVQFDEGVMTGIEWPAMVLRHRVVDDTDLVVLTGTEPNWNWRRFAEEVSRLARSLGVARHVSLGGIPWATPHTRPVTIVTTASDRTSLLDAHPHPEGTLRVPGSAVSVLEKAVADAGIPTVGLWARVPQYVGTTFSAAALALVEAVSALLGVEFDVRGLAEEASAQRVHLDAIVAARPDVKAIVDKLEAIVDETGLASGEELAAEIERFLRSQEGDES